MNKELRELLYKAKDLLNEIQSELENKIDSVSGTNLEYTERNERNKENLEYIENAINELDSIE